MWTTMLRRCLSHSCSTKHPEIAYLKLSVITLRQLLAYNRDVVVLCTPPGGCPVAVSSQSDTLASSCLQWCCEEQHRLAACMMPPCSCVVLRSEAGQRASPICVR